MVPLPLNNPSIADNLVECPSHTEHIDTLTPGEALDLLRQLEQRAADTREYVPAGWVRPTP